MIVCLDTCILVWGVQGAAASNNAAKPAQARALLQQLETEKATIIIPAPVVFEFLLRVHYTPRDILRPLKS
jgi:hypothetical protein